MRVSTANERMANDQTYRHWRNLRGEHQANVRELRRDMTPCEKTLWNAVRGRSISGVKFRRQHPLQGFILDFYAPEIALAVEIDGDIHDDPERKQYDLWREGILNASGLKIIRFQNAEIAINLPSVLERLQEAIAELRSKKR